MEINALTSEEEGQCLASKNIFFIMTVNNKSLKFTLGYVRADPFSGRP